MNGMNIGLKLNKLGREDLIFKYEVDNYDDLVLHNNFLLSKLSKFHADCKLPNTLRYLTDVEQNNSIDAIKNGKTEFKEEDVIYNVNELGYRTNNPISGMKNAVGVFGCSFTFGVGVPDENLCTTILERYMGQPVYNFGIPGGGIQKLTKSFTSINSLYKLKTAVFIIPSFYRYEFISSPNKNLIDQTDFIPNYKPTDKRGIENFDSIYSAFDNVTFLNELSKHLNLIKMSAKLNGTDVYFTTWCRDTINLIDKYKVEKFQTQVFFTESFEQIMGKKVTDFARDGLHPGVRTHMEVANSMYSFITAKPKLI